MFKDSFIKISTSNKNNPLKLNIQEMYILYMLLNKDKISNKNSLIYLYINVSIYKNILKKFTNDSNYIVYCLLFIVFFSKTFNIKFIFKKLSNNLYTYFSLTSLSTITNHNKHTIFKNTQINFLTK